jgi:hypothetical protein
MEPPPHKRTLKELSFELRLADSGRFATVGKKSPTPIFSVI